MKRKIPKRVIMFLALGILMAGVLPVGVVEARAAGMSLADLQAKFPGGKYWNHATQSGHEYNGLEHSGNCNNPDGYTEYPCTGHDLYIQGAGYYDCNTYGGGLQCCGFAYKLADDAYGSMPNSWGTASVENAKAGDVIHFYTGDTWGHWAMIIDRNGTTVTLGECNYDYHCRIDWGRECNLSGQSYIIYSAPGELQTSSAPGISDNDNDFKVSENEDHTVVITGYQGRGGNIEIPSEIGGKKVVAIGASAFYDCDSLESVSIPGSVTDIGEKAFFYCSNLTTVTIREGLVDIGKGAFKQCYMLESIDIPDSVANIGEEAFSSCIRLSGVTIPNSVANIGKEAFFYCDSLENVIIPGSVTNLGEGAFSDCYGLSGVTLREGVTDIGNSAFLRCRSLTSIILPNSLKRIGNGAFSCCESLAGINVPGGVTDIGENAFEYCDSLEHIEIPKGVTGIGERTFGNCISLTSVSIPNGVISIGERAFNGCVSLECVAIPESVTSIGNYAFCSCEALISVTILNNVMSIGDSAFQNCKSMASVSIPASVMSIGNSAFDKSFLTIIYGESGTEAERYAKKNGFEFKPTQGGGSLQGGGNLPIACAHSYNASVIPASAKTNGSIVEKCVKCGNEKSRTAIYAASGISLSRTSYTYSGKTCRPSVTVKDSMGRILKNNTDYIVSFPEKSKNVGKYVLTVTLRGNYSGTVKKTFDVVPKGTSIFKVAAKKKGFAVKWKKQAKQTTGYEVQYSASSRFAKKSTKIADAGKSRMTSKSVSKLKSKKKYYVRIRTYKTVKNNGKSVKLYSGWSKAKAVITKN